MAIKRRSGGGGDWNTAAPTTGAPGEGWEDAPTDFARRVVHMDIIGLEGTGRSRLALTAPGPIAYINSDEKIQGIVQPFARQKSVKIATYGFIATGDKQADLTAAEAVWGRVKGWMRDSIGWARTTVFDTATEGWEVCRLANFGELNPKGRIDNTYGPVNAEFRGVFKQFRLQERANLITIHQVKDHYVDRMVNGRLTGVNTGQTKRAGFKEFGYMADVVIRTSKEGGVFLATIEKGWFNAATEGTTLENDDIRFPFIMSLITETPEEEWS